MGRVDWLELALLQRLCAHASTNRMLTASLVLKQVHPDTGISNRAMSILNSFVNGKGVLRLYLNREPELTRRVRYL